MTARRTLKQLLDTAHRNTLVGLKVSITAEVLAYNPETRTADVQPVLANATGDTAAPVLDVPVLWPGGGGYTVHLALQAGDYVTLVVSDRSNDDWHEGVDNPSDRYERSHDISDAVAFPVVHRRSDEALTVVELGAWFGKVGALVGVGLDGVIRLGSEEPSDHVALALLVLAELNKVKAAFDAHGHISSAGTSSTPVSATVPGIPPLTFAPDSPASNKVRSD